MSQNKNELIINSVQIYPKLVFTPFCGQSTV